MRARFRPLFALLLALAPAAGSAQSLDSGLVAYYPFDRTLRDLAAGGHNGTALVGSAPAYVAGRFGEAADFDGVNDAVRFPTLPNSVFAGNFSVGWFIRASSLAHYAILGNRPGCTNGHYLDLTVSTNQPDRVSYILRAGTPIAGVLSAPIALDRWVHLLAVREGGTIRIYTDGVASSTVTAPAPDFSLNTTPLGISTSPCIAHGDGTRFLDAQVDELRVYNRALSAADARALAQGEGVTQAGTVVVTPSTVGAGGRFVLNAEGVDGNGVSCRARLGFTGTSLGAAQPDASGVVRAEIQLAPDSGTGAKTIVLECLSPTAAPVIVGHDTLLVDDSLLFSAPASGFAGQAIDFEVTGLVGNRFELWAGASRVYGPVAVVGGEVTGTFSVPAAGPGASGALTLTARGYTGGLQTSVATRGFTRTADPGYRVRIDSVQLPPATPPESLLTVGGRIQVASGSPQSRSINLFYRGADGRVIPLGRRDVVPDALGNFSLPVEMPSAATQDGYIARGQGSFFFTFTEIDEITRAVRTVTQQAGFTESPGYPNFGEGARAIVTVRANDGTPLAGAYVVVGDGDPDVLTDTDPATGNAADATLGPLNQLSPQAQTPVVGYQACPLSLASGYTDASGRFEFLVDPNAVRQKIQFRRIACTAREGNLGDACTATLAWDTRISVQAAHLGYGVVQSGVVVPVIIPAEFRPLEAGGGRFVDPGTGQNYNTLTSAWQPVVTLQPITPALSVRPYRRRGEINDPPTGSPGGDLYKPLSFVVDSQTGRAWYTPGRFFDLGSASPQGCAPDRICITGSAQGEFQVSYFHDARVAGDVQFARLVSCADGGFDCAATGANTVALQLDPNQPAGPAACGNGVARYFAVMPRAPVVNARARSRIEVRTFFTPPGGSIGRVLDGRANLQVRLDPIPAWFNGPGTRFSNRVVSQFANGLASFSAVESLTGGGPSAVDASSSEFSEVNLDSPQRNNTNSTRRLERWQLNATTPPAYESNALTTSNKVANNDGADIAPDANSLPSTADLDVQEIIDTGKIPLFRFTYGVPPIAAATLGADFWLNAAVRYGGALTLDADVPNIVYITEPFSEFGLDLFFDLSAIGGLVSATVEASASVYLSNRSQFEDGVLDPSTFQCFGFNLDVTFEICVLFCGSYTENLISVYKNRPDNQDGRSQCITDTLGLPRFPTEGFGKALAGGAPPRPMLRARAESSLAYAPNGRGTLVHVDDQGRLLMRSLPLARLDDPGAIVVEPFADAVTSTATAALGGVNGGVALWSYVPGSPASIDAGTAQQHIKWARTTSDGAQFQPRNLTEPGAGDGSVVVGACPSGVAGCPAGGEATAVWLRRVGANWDAHHYALMYARFTPNTGWSTPARIDPAQGQASDLLPSVAYRRSNGTPVVFWVRKPTPGFDNPQTRRIAYRFLDGSSPVRIADSLPAGVTWPSATSRRVANGNLAVEEIALAYTVNVDPVAIAGRPKAFVGNTNALHVARCSFGAAGTCTFTDEELRDGFGRNLRAEKPSIAADSGGAVAVGFNGLGFGPDANGATQRSSDPIGMLSGQGDLVLVRPRLDGTPVSVVDIDLGSIGAFKPSLVFNPALDAFDAVSQPLDVGVGALVAARKSLGLRTVSKGAAGAVSGSVRFASLAAGPDLRVVAAVSPQRRLAPGGTVPVQVTIRNLGRAPAPALPDDLRLVATWDGPAGSAADAASVPLPALATDAATTLSFDVPVPAGFAVDETHALVLTAVAASSIGEVDGSDNQRTLVFGSMPVPVDLRLVREPGQPMVFLRWSLDDPTDDRVAGFRVMRVEADGSRTPLGSTPVQGFVDLSAAIGETRRYVVTSYSANGVESAESDFVTGEAAPAAGAGGDPLFGDGFESAP